jgi:hypothetical protein
MGLGDIMRMEDGMLGDYLLRMVNFSTRSGAQSKTTIGSARESELTRYG